MLLKELKESGWDRFDPNSEQYSGKDAEYNRHGQGKYDGPKYFGMTNSEIEGKDFYASDVSNEQDYVMVLVRNANEESNSYHGVNVLLYPDGKVDASTVDSIADKEWEDHKAVITKIAKAKAGIKESVDDVKAIAKRIEMYMREMRKQGEMADIEDALGNYARDMRKAGVTRDEVYDEWRKTYN